MTIDIALVAVGSIAVALALWFYPHCARPALARAGARSSAFTLALFGALVMAGSSVLMALTGLLQVAWGSRLVAAVGLVGWILPSIAYLRPRWLVRLTGGPDWSVPVRYVAIWFRSVWRDSHADAPSARQFVAGMHRALGELPPEVDPALVGRWVRELEDLRRAADAGPTTLARQRQRLAEAFAAIVPVDPLGRWLPA